MGQNNNKDIRPLNLYRICISAPLIAAGRRPGPTALMKIGGMLPVAPA
jgi:hypothetical protein